MKHKFKPLTRDDVTFTVTCEPEHIPVRGNAIASGDDELDAATEDKILADLEAGNVWAWCCVKVTAEWQGFKGTDYLGACSYESEEQFMDTEEGFYLPDMRERALDDLNEKLARMAEQLDPVLVCP